jgi:phosphoribosylaminoimidazole carboxylase (NCAIR synthetase)
MDKKVGILGTGQLAMMLTEAGRKLGLDVVAAPSLNQIPQADIITFENEFVDTSALRSEAMGLGIEFVPSLRTISLLQDKLQQKRLFDSIRIPTAACDDDPQSDDITPRVLKWSRQGYDGHGVFFVKADTPVKKIKEFFDSKLL